MAIKYPWMAPLKKTYMDWHYEWPSDTTRVKYIGDVDICMSHDGDGRALLYQLKSYMGIAKDINVLSRGRNYLDGTQIYVSSCYGIDTIVITAPPKKKEGLEPFCTLKILDLPDIIPPMEWHPLDIGQSDVDRETRIYDKESKSLIIRDTVTGVSKVNGVDYIKTYFSWVTTDCPACSPMILSVPTEEYSHIIESDYSNNPFWYKSEDDDGSLIYQYNGQMVPHYMGNELSIPHKLPNPKNHMIYSLNDLGQVEIVEISLYDDGKNTGRTVYFMNDAGGSFFVWKAYTEWENSGPYGIDYFSANGLGYMLMNGVILNGGLELCKSDSTIIKVDCCVKSPERRSIQQADRPGYSGLWWESDPYTPQQNCYNQPFMYRGSMKMCEVPSSISITTLYIMACIPVHPVSFYVLPDLNGSCLPYEWKFTGPGIWTTTGDFKEIGVYNCQSVPMCDEEVDIEVTDRCGTVTTVHASSCCSGKTESLEITYTSLLMACSQTQTFYVTHGCGPYEWSISGGGYFTYTAGNEATYKAPAQNINCTQNPTITVTDCCGDSAEIKLAVNCYGATGKALGIVYWLECSGCFCNPAGCDQGISGCFDWINNMYDCNGTLYSHCETRPCGTGSPPCSSQGNYVHVSCETCSIGVMGGTCPPVTCWQAQCGCAVNSNCPCDVLVDARTTALLAAGCCPLNPFTGLPYG